MKSKKVNIKEITKITNNIPKTLLEAVDFADSNLSDSDFGFENEDDEMMEQSMDMEEIPSSNKMDMPETPMNNKPSMGGENGIAVVDKIRKMALRTMADLADNPEDQAYIILKKVWQMCDKKSEENKNNENM